IQELARSIREVGLLTPMIVRPWDNDANADGPLPMEASGTIPQYRLIAGHRRHAALTALSDAEIEGFDAVLCEVREGLSVAEAYAVMLTENVQRVALEPVQAARALRLLLDLNENMDAATLARSLGLSPKWAQKHLKLLDLPREVQDRIEAGDLSVTIADLLRTGQSTGRIDEAKMVELAHKVASGEITTAQAREVAGPAKAPNTVAPKTVAMGADGRPVNPTPATPWKDMQVNSLGGYDIPPRPATPLSNNTSTPPQSPMPSGPIAAAADGTVATTVFGAEVPLEDRLDIYLLGRALTEWADDDYLELLGIDRVQTEAYAAALDFEERIGAIRHLSHTLLQADGVLAPA
ncbi:MAG: ParB/RepB/Spo0J family partition protein, partial [Thermoleophilia bacterium]|nr:ParB/RepB/Spo0J family partition protein [Thermoleophilia bacterium]